MNTPISYGAATQRALATGTTTEAVQGDDRALKVTAPQVLPKQVGELREKKDTLHRLEGDYSSAERTLIDLVHEWDGLLDSRADLKRSLAGDRERVRLWTDALVNLEANMSAFRKFWETNQAKLVEVEASIVAFSKKHNIALSKLS